MTKKISLLILIFLFLPVFVFADNQFPSFPMAFWGNMTIDGNASPVGTVIYAYYGNILAGQSTITEAGIYGYNSPVKQKLLVGDGNGTITFKFQSLTLNGGTESAGCAEVSYTGFVSGLTVEKDLAFYTSGCGGGSGGGGTHRSNPPVISLIGGNVTIYQGSTYVDAGATALDNVDGDITANIVVVNPVSATSTAGAYAITYNVSDIAGNHAVEVARTVNVLAVASSSQLLSDNTMISASAPEILVGDNNTASSTITIPDSVTNATINISAITTTTATSVTATIQGAITINASTTIGAVKVEIPAGLQITAGTSTWNGIINVPQIKENSTVTATPDSGHTATVSSVIEIGFGNILLSFDKAVRIKITGQAGKYVGYSRNGVFTPITNVCSADSQAAGNALAGGGDCKISVGSDLIIWTKHFTNFVTYTQTAIPPADSGGGGGGGGGYVPPTTPLLNKKADINGDNKVDKYDFALLMANWGKTGTNTCDLNNDGKVDKYDFALLMLNWSK